MNTYIIVSAITLLVLGIAWKKNDVINFLVKLFIIGLGLIGIFYYLLSMGFILKIH